jgi:hypothetical protein
VFLSSKIPPSSFVSLSVQENPLRRLHYRRSVELVLRFSSCQTRAACAWLTVWKNAAELHLNFVHLHLDPEILLLCFLCVA